ncbi:MAG TPA: hypothetical protein VKE72_05080, partial [Methylocella sp.]|nr:hypothetical protein [Methylocella sp.]
VCALLTRFMGPISTHLVREESHGAASLEDLSLRLAARIPGEKDRALFVKERQRANKTHFLQYLTHNPVSQPHASSLLPVTNASQKPISRDPNPAARPF